MTVNAKYEKKSIKISNNDSVGVALKPLSSGEEHLNVTLLESVEIGHKFALHSIKMGQSILKYGHSIGVATQNINVGEKVHLHNMTTCLQTSCRYHYAPVSIPTVCDVRAAPTINAYVRANGDIAIRNELWIIPTVGCMNAIGQRLVQYFKQQHALKDIDDLYFYGHPLGCSQLGKDLDNTRALLQCLIQHPHAGGVLVLGLGCENNQIDQLRSSLGTYNADRVKFLVGQHTEDEIAEGMCLLTSLYQVMRHDKRQCVSMGRLKVGLKCGGSDGLSGITANPLLGAFSDYFTKIGGSVVLTEVPEMFGAEHILMNRAVDKTVFHAIVALIDQFKNYFLKYGMAIHSNPSPGNHDGGITTLEEKALGCIQKAGTSKITDVIQYAKRINTNGLTLLEAPGNDLISITALAASGCHLILFTTGRGTPAGTCVPTMKISTHSALALYKKHWIDFNAGQLLDCKMTTLDLLQHLIDHIVCISNGQKVKNECNFFKEIALFKTGVTL